MSASPIIPLSNLVSEPATGVSLGDHLVEQLASSNINSFIDCLCTSPEPVIYSSDIARPSLTHNQLREFVSNFELPKSSTRDRMGPNDRVMILLPSGPENAVALIALASYFTCAPLNATCTAQELRDDATRLKAKAIIAMQDSAERLDLLHLRKDLHCDVIFVEERTSGPAGLFDMSVMGIRDEMTGSPSRAHTMDDQSIILHTSGTSGKKKVVPYSLRSLIVGTWSVALSWNLQPSDVNINMMPIFHIGGIVRNLFAPVFSGGSAIMCSGFDAFAWWGLSQQLRATWYYAAPVMHNAILGSQPENVDAAADLCIRMICNAAGGLLPSLAVKLSTCFGGAAILPSYGMTECMPICSPLQNYRLERPGTSGVACGPYMSIRDTLNLELELPVGKTGAVSVRGCPTFTGYETSPDISVPLDTSAFSSEGWFDSGDVGYMDADGYLYITGRSKEIINTGGEVVSPFEVEEAIVTSARTHVKSALAFAIDHDTLQEVIGVVIIPSPDVPRMGLAQLHKALNGNLHRSKWPFAIVYMDDLPKNSAGKALRIKLAQRLGITSLNDSIPPLRRHYEATAPPITATLADPIPSSGVSVDLDALTAVLKATGGINDVAARCLPNGSADVFVSVDASSDITATYLSDFLANHIPGYCIPDPIRLLPSPLTRSSDGDVDFNSMEKELNRINASQMGPQLILVRDIIASLLSIEKGSISAESDFFLLGGNSLLLGKFVYLLRKATGVTVPVVSIFPNSSVDGIASLVDAEKANSASDDMDSSSVTLHDVYDNLPEPHFRGATHPISIIVQSIPILFFYPLKAAFSWTFFLFVLSGLGPELSGSILLRLVTLLVVITMTGIATAIVMPLVAILFKWIIIGRYVPGRYKMWSNYHLRWWLVDQWIRSSRRGIFNIHPVMQHLYYRLLGANIGRDVHIAHGAQLAECDLLTFGDGCRIDTALVRGFRVETDGYFTLDTIVVGQGAVINTFTQLSPGAVVADGAVYGPHASSFDPASPPGHAAYNRTASIEPNWKVKFFIAYPILIFVSFLSYLPWFGAMLLVLNQPILSPGLDSLESVIFFFTSWRRIIYHLLSRVVKALVVPLLELCLGLAVRRAFGYNKPGLAEEQTQLMILRRYLKANLLSSSKLSAAFHILGAHYEIVSIVYRAMGAKIGRRVYWPGSGVYCPDPELLELGDDIVFGSRSELFTTDSIGTAKIIVKSGGMVADRCVLLPGTTVGRRTVMGSGALGKRDTDYPDGSTWIGSENGEALCFSRGTKETVSTDADSTITPFGRAYYQRKASYYVFPYPLLVFINCLVVSISALYWSLGAIATAQILKQIHIHLARLHLFKATWYRLGTIYGLIAASFTVVLFIQVILAVGFVIAAKWTIIGRRHVGQYDWDKSSYCQRWKLHLTVSRLLSEGYGRNGVLASLTGTAYMTWYFRALGAKIGNNCSIFAGGKRGLMTEPDLLEIGDDVSLDNCSVVAHINSSGNFALNPLQIGSGCALRTGSRLLSGASMEDGSLLSEHTLLTSGEVADAATVYIGWPAKHSVGLTKVHRRSRGQSMSNTATLSAV